MNERMKQERIINSELRDSLVHVWLHTGEVLRKKFIGDIRMEATNNFLYIFQKFLKAFKFLMGFNLWMIYLEQKIKQCNVDDDAPRAQPPSNYWKMIKLQSVIDRICINSANTFTCSASWKNIFSIYARLENARRLSGDNDMTPNKLFLIQSLPVWWSGRIIKLKVKTLFPSDREY